MSNINKKGFVLIETLVVTVFVVTLFLLVYRVTMPSIGEYEQLDKYDDVDSIYYANVIKRMLLRYADFTKIDAAIMNEPYYLDITDCNSDVYLNKEYCDAVQNMLFQKNINYKSEDFKILITKYDLTNFKSYVSNHRAQFDSDDLTNFIDYLNTVGNEESFYYKIKDSNLIGKYRIFLIRNIRYADSQIYNSNAVVSELNIDTNNDGLADLNLDKDNNGMCDLNCDTDNDNICDFMCDTDNDGTADTNINRSLAGTKARRYTNIGIYAGGYNKYLAGDVVKFDPGDGIKTFYVLNTSLSTDPTIDLILADDIDVQTQFNASGKTKLKPSLALAKLDEITQGWTNVSYLANHKYSSPFGCKNNECNYTIDYSGYRARFLEESDIQNLLGCGIGQDDCFDPTFGFDFLYANLPSVSEHPNNAQQILSYGNKAYWTAMTVRNDNYAWVVNNEGIKTQDASTQAYIRPVITVYKDTAELTKVGE